MSERPFTHVIKRSGAVVPFNQERISNAIFRAAVAVGGRDRERAAFLAGEVVRYLADTLPPGHVPAIEEIQDAVEKILIENGHAAVAKAYILYRDEAARRRAASGQRAAKPSETIPWAKVWQGLDWAVRHDLDTVEGLNGRIAAGEFAQIVHESESVYEDDVATAAELLLARRDQVRLVLITGPSSSGKTTTTEKLEARLRKAGLAFQVLNVDHYFLNLDAHPRDEFGDYDYETPQALDLDLINEHLQRLLAGEAVAIPYYDFMTGKRREAPQPPLQLGANELLLIDSLHGLYPAMTEGVAGALKFRLYLEPLLQMRGPDDAYIRWTDIRLMRRMLRDAVHRAWSPQQTLEHWHYVRASELRHILPYQATADYIINSAMPYEIALYRPRLLDSFQKWTAVYRDDPLREDAYRRAVRVADLLESVKGVADDSPVPAASVLREFIGP